jgi:hypothetical protein
MRIFASGTYLRNVGDNGWHHLTVRAGEGFFSSPDSSHRDYVKALNYAHSMQAAGFLEGYATCNEIGQSYANTYMSLVDGNSLNREALEFLEENYLWMAAQAEQLWPTSDYWLAVKGLVAQLEGLLAGVKAGCPESHTTTAKPASHGDSDDYFKDDYLPSLASGVAMIHLLLLNANGDIIQISNKFNNTSSEGRKAGSMSTSAAVEGRSSFAGSVDVAPNARANIQRRQSSENYMGKRRLGGNGGSALIKLTADSNDVLMGHSAWRDFQTLGPRIFKHYSLPLILGLPHKELEAAAAAPEKSEDNRSQAHRQSRRLENIPGGITEDTDDYATDDSGSGGGSSGSGGGTAEQVHSTFLPEKGRLELHFSSYPAVLTSADNFFVVVGQGQFVVMDTS